MTANPKALIPDLLAEFREKNLPNIAEHLGWYANAGSLKEAIRRAAAAERGSDKIMHDHQCLVGKSKLSRIADPLLSALENAENPSCFEGLFKTVTVAIGSLPRIGDLAMYDTALRLGVYFGIKPTNVYLQSGARKGAKAFYRQFRQGVPLPSGRHVPASSFHPELDRLTPLEIENFLCVMEKRI